MHVTRGGDGPVLFEEISPRGPTALMRLRRLRSEVCGLFIAGGVISAALWLAWLG